MKVKEKQRPFFRRLGIINLMLLFCLVVNFSSCESEETDEGNAEGYEGRAITGEYYLISMNNTCTDSRGNSIPSYKEKLEVSRVKWIKELS